jgi:hypothetical protein
MWKYDTGIRGFVPVFYRSLDGQGFAGDAGKKFVDFDVSREDKSAGLFAMKATCEARVSKTKERRNCVARRSADERRV